MQLTLEVSQEEIDQLDAMRSGAARQRSREEMAHSLLSETLKVKAERADALDRVFGIWADRDIDGLEYQLRLRREWDREF